MYSYKAKKKNYFTPTKPNLVDMLPNEQRWWFQFLKMKKFFVSLSDEIDMFSSAKFGFSGTIFQNTILIYENIININIYKYPSERQITEWEMEMWFII